MSKDTVEGWRADFRSKWEGANTGTISLSTPAMNEMLRDIDRIIDLTLTKERERIHDEIKYLVGKHIFELYDNTITADEFRDEVTRYAYEHLTPPDQKLPPGTIIQNGRWTDAQKRITEDV